MNKWDYPKLEDVDEIGFTVINQHLYDLLFELHMAQNQKLIKKRGETYWDNFCNMVEWLSTRVDEAIYARDSDS